MSLFGLYRGVVVDDQDPESLLRLKVQVPQLFGPSTTDWAYPCVTDLTVTPPTKGDPVWVAFEAGDENHPIWVGTWRKVGG